MDNTDPLTPSSMPNVTAPTTQEESSSLLRDLGAELGSGVGEDSPDTLVRGISLHSESLPGIRESEDRCRCEALPQAPETAQPPWETSAS